MRWAASQYVGQAGRYLLQVGRCVGQAGRYIGRASQYVGQAGQCLGHVHMAPLWAPLMLMGSFGRMGVSVGRLRPFLAQTFWDKVYILETSIFPPNLGCCMTVMHPRPATSLTAL